MNTATQISAIVKKFNLDLSQTDDVGNKAIERMSDFLDGVDYEVWEDGISIKSSEDEIIGISKGNYNTIHDFEEEANERYLSAFEEEAALI